MSATTIFVIVLILVFLGGMIGLQIYMNSGKPSEQDKKEDAQG